jgi:hypothetical protein
MNYFYLYCLFEDHLFFIYLFNSRYLGVIFVVQYVNELLWVNCLYSQVFKGRSVIHEVFIHFEVSVY